MTVCCWQDARVRLPTNLLSFLSETRPAGMSEVCARMRSISLSYCQKLCLSNFCFPGSLLNAMSTKSSWDLTLCVSWTVNRTLTRDLMTCFDRLEVTLCSWRGTRRHVHQILLEQTALRVLNCEPDFNSWFDDSFRSSLSDPVQLTRHETLKSKTYLTWFVSPWYDVRGWLGIRWRVTHYCRARDVKIQELPNMIRFALIWFSRLTGLSMASTHYWRDTGRYHPITNMIYFARIWRSRLTGHWMASNSLLHCPVQCFM